MKVIRVTKKEFELENGEIYKHPFIFSNFISKDNFQKIIDHCPNFQLICEYVKNSKIKEKRK